MDSLRRLLKRRTSYEPLQADPLASNHASNAANGHSRFSRVDYAVFFLLGIAMLWGWCVNPIRSSLSETLHADSRAQEHVPLSSAILQSRFGSIQALLSNFQAAEVSTSTVANLSALFILTKLQAKASYPKRIIISLTINIVVFALLTVSTKAFLDVGAKGYFAFLITIIFVSSIATGFMQNGAFAYAAGFGRSEYAQAIMMGQAVAGVLPPLVQIISVLSADTKDNDIGEGTSTSAFAYFLAASAVSAIALAAFLFVLKFTRPEHPAAAGVLETPRLTDDENDGTEFEGQETVKKSVPLTYLFRRLFFFASAVFLTFAITMVFPVFTQEILSAKPNPSPLFRKDAFIPFAFLVWNVGDLLGRLVPLVPQLSLAHRPRILLLLSIVRVIWIPLYLICNIQPPEAPSHGYSVSPTIRSDAFYLLAVQLPFGITNGYLGSCCMMGAGDFVEDDEREATGGFMGLMLSFGLAAGSIASFLVGDLAR